jgi:hypothetical protein
MVLRWAGLRGETRATPKCLGERLSGASSGKRNKCRRPSALGLKTRRHGDGQTRR